ncbi:YiaA/YiaB family inner membrane protein [Ottowia testudinis]|uniref:YiaAB two helix domain-containing protein n=1 Tax=Ottowia testudinis TaxID=2816950 RepID=A0A975H3I8_9BURK|nr:YiaA/YiaB family inner membrane protein [Ottowia testudinis]QTD45874.1 hypothetical protein J1M35_02850 [Ottowia testudinis]
MHPPFIRRDTMAWQLQVWTSFGIAVTLCAIGLAYLPGRDLDRAFMFMGYLFCLCTSFVLSKFVRDGEAPRAEGRAADTPMFRFVVWGGFGLAMALTGWGLIRMDINDTYKVFLGVSWLYLITGAFTLAKMLRDRQEADLLEAQWRGRRDARAQFEQKTAPAPV